jgi:uncharacterized OB-fold protein
MKKFGYVSLLNQTEEVDKLLEGLQQGKLVTSKCKKCGVTLWSNHIYCSNCGERT